ncbi:MAG: biotin--[acetyl-CoA-carboxylase] ligase [Angelakisella sp.]
MPTPQPKKELSRSDRLLKLLLAGQDKAQSGQALSEQLGVTRAAVWKEVEALRQQGYRIESGTNRGYRLSGQPNTLEPALLRAASCGCAHPIVYLDSVDSTLLYANRLVLDGAENGTVVLADRQTAGVGRLGRSFASPAGVGIYLTMVLEPHCTVDRLGLLTSLAGLAVCEAISSLCGVSPALKWPNDVILQGKKVCGILTRLVSDAETATVTHALVGIGVNVLQQEFPPELSEKAISLWQATGIALPRAELAARIVHGLTERLITENWLQAPPADTVARLRALSCTLGKAVTVVSPTGSRQGVAEALDDSGGLLVRFAEGVELVSSGEVSVRGLLGYAE